MSITRRGVLAIPAACLGAPGLVRGALAQTGYPDRPIHVSIGFSAGSGADILSRYFAHKLEELSKQPVIMENKPGATGNIAVRYVARSEPDGYNILFVANSNMAGSRYLFKEVPFDSLNDFKPVASFAQIAFVLTVSPNSPINSQTRQPARLATRRPPTR